MISFYCVEHSYKIADVISLLTVSKEITQVININLSIKFIIEIMFSVANNKHHILNNNYSGYREIKFEVGCD